MKRLLLLLTSMLMLAPAKAELQVVELYSQDELLQMIRANTHLIQMKRDDCQLLEDVRAHAKILKEPAYQMLWGDMLMYGVCVDEDVRRGFSFLEAAGNAGLADAHEQLGRYYQRGEFTVVSPEKAVHFYKLAAEQGHLRAQFSLAKMYINGFGAPRDYPQAYRWIFERVYEYPELKQEADQLLAQLSQKIPGGVVESIQADRKFQDEYR